MAASPGALYPGRVMHHRLRPFRHRFTSRVTAVCLDLDRIGDLDLRLFSHNRPNLFSFYDRDHGPRDGSPLRPWVERLLAEAGLAPDGGRIELLCLPRLLGYVFNPISLYFCHDRRGRIAAIVHEVKNTFGEQHAYVLPVPAGGGAEAIEQACDKRFFVSPFIGMAAHYRFLIRPPGERVSVVIRESVPEGPQLLASLTGRRVPLDDRQLLRVLLRTPLMTFKVISAIHWHALLLWLRGARYHRHEAASSSGASFGPAPAPRGARIRPDPAKVKEV